MRKLLIALILTLITAICYSQVVNGPLGENFSYRIVADKLSDPWEITFDPKGYLCVAEAKGYRISRINVNTGAKTLIADLNSAKNFNRNINAPQGGLSGFALHPNAWSGKPYVYLSYIYKYVKSLSNDGGTYYNTKIVRYNINFTNGTLINPVTLCDTIPGSNDHNGGRLLIAPVGGVNYLFYSAGDMGAGQFNNGGRTNNAQNTQIYEGKILRFNLEQDADANTIDKWIPNDNPYNGIRQSAVYTIGHRNPQGLAYATISGIPRIYSVEHGPFSDDEVNIIERKKNYGHPLIIGMNDGNYDGLAAAATANTTLPGTWQTSCPTIQSESINASNIGIDFKPPIKTLYPSPKSYLNTILTAVKNNNYSSGNPTANSNTWQSEAPSSIEVYTQNAIPGWNNSLLITTLKGGKLIRLKLNSTGDAIQGDTICYFRSANRYRDIAISPDGTKIYVAVDSSLITSGPSATNPQVSTNRGCIIEFTYKGTSTITSAKPTQTTSTTLAAAVRLFPNPAANKVTVVTNSTTGRKLYYTISDISGKTFVTGTNDKRKFEINISSLPSGLYVLRVLNAENHLVKVSEIIKK